MSSATFCEHSNEKKDLIAYAITAVSKDSVNGNERKYVAGVALSEKGAITLCKKISKSSQNIYRSFATVQKVTEPQEVVGVGDERNAFVICYSNGKIIIKENVSND